MQDRILKESRRHGDLFLPISNYQMNLHNSKILLDCHWHEELELFKVLKGAFRFQIASQYFEVTEGELLFINSGELHSAMAEHDGDFAYSAVVFSPDMLEGSANDKIQMEYLSPLLKGQLAVQRLFQQKTQQERNLQNYFDQIYSLLEEKPTAYEIALKAYLFFILGELIRTGSTPVRGDGMKDTAAESIKNVIEYMQGNYQTNITITMLAQRCSVSPGHFCRMFKRYTMKTPVEYINCFRLSKAAQMLETTDRKVLDIALDCGFNSLSYFINIFHENVGCTPSDFRKKANNS
jgi:AraC-like DNA-binding protein